MRGFHFSLRWLFGVVSVLAIGCGLLIYASPFLSKLTFTAAIVAFIVAAFVAVHRCGERRALWAGFAVFGMAYLWLICGAWQSPDGSTPLRDRLVTTDLLTRCHELLPARQTSVTMTSAPLTTSINPYAANAGYVAYDAYGNLVQSGQAPVGASFAYPLTTITSTVTTTVDRTDFLSTGHSLFAIAFAVIGGMIVRTSYRRSKAA
jgi:hypothetical protein